MNPQTKKEIVAYLSGPRDHAVGAELYRKYGANLRLKRQFTIDSSATSREILIDELRRLAGLTGEEYRRLPRLAKTPAASEPEPEAEPDADDIEKNEEAPEPVKKMIRFRERFPFLNEDSCPDELKVLVADMFTAYGRYKAAFARLQTLADEDSEAAAAECGTVVEEYLRNREIWEELEYYRENGAVLGKAAKLRAMAEAEDLSKLSDVELMGKLQSAQAQESKARKKIETLKADGADTESAEAALVRWSARKTELKAEVEKRKKK